MKRFMLRWVWASLVTGALCGTTAVWAQTMVPAEAGPADAMQTPRPPAAPAPPTAPAPPMTEAAAPAPAKAPRSADVPTVISIAKPEAPAVEESQTDADQISITLDDVPLVDVVRMFTRISGANIIADAAELQGAVTVNLQDVRWKPALQSILDMHDLTLVEKQLGSDVFSIVPRAADAPTPMITKSFNLKFATVGDIRPVVQNMLVDGGKLTEFPSRNLLVVRSTSENLSAIDEIIKEIDKPTKQVSIETKFMELTDAATRQLGIRWDSLAAFGLQLQAGPFTWNRATQESFSRTDNRELWDRRNNVNSLTRNYAFDGVPLVDRSFELFDDDNDPATPPAVITEEVPTLSITDTIDTGQNYGQTIVNQFSRSIEQSQAAILNVDQFQVVLSALKTTDGVTMVSNPKMIVANGATNAQFSVGSREPIIRTEIVSGTTDSPGDKITAELDTAINTDFIKQGYLETGIDLRVIPVVKTDDLIEAEIVPSLRRKTGDKQVANNSWPIIAVKEIRTRFTLQSGQTVAIGGLTDTTEQKETSKVPLLGDIPLIGRYLFSHTRDVESQVETIIFVTLALASPEGLYENAGVPQQARLVHRSLLRERMERQEAEAQLQELRETADEAEREKSTKARTRLLRRR